MTRISPEYLAMQSQFHVDTPNYGVSGSHHSDAILGLAKTLETRDILDYGCGKATLQKGIPYPIQNYDPCCPEYERRPVPARIVVCTDVLEHIEPDCIKDVMDDLRELTLTMLYVNVSTREAKKMLPDGRNAHLIIQDGNWWLSWFLPRFTLHSFQATKGSFSAIFVPIPAPVEEDNA